MKHNTGHPESHHARTDAADTHRAGGDTPLFRSFWMGGFESACHINGCGRLDMLSATQHDRFVDDDYRRLRSVGIAGAREGIRWHRVDRGDGDYDFSSLMPFIEASERHGIQVIWTLCHYGWPDDVELLSDAFVDRFTAYCRAVARLIRGRGNQTNFYTPVNEINFFAWAAGTAGYIHPYGRDLGGAIKRQLVRAWIGGCRAILDIDPEARFVTSEPLIHVVPTRMNKPRIRLAHIYRESQFEATDMMCGRLAPELGGEDRFLDIVGLNFYASNQWQCNSIRLAWIDKPIDPRWVPLHNLLIEVWERYRRTMIMSETSHYGTGRAVWLREVTQELIHARTAGVPIQAVCLYPILDRPDWDNPSHWHNSGMWDMTQEPDGTLHRVLQPDYAAELRRSQAAWSSAFPQFAPVSPVAPDRTPPAANADVEVVPSNGNGEHPPARGDLDTTGCAPQSDRESSSDDVPVSRRIVRTPLGTRSPLDSPVVPSDAPPLP